MEAQAATLDLVAKESADAKRLLDELREENGKAEDKLKRIEQKTLETAQLAEPVELKFNTAIRNKEMKDLCATVFFNASKNESLGKLEFDVEIIGTSAERIIKLWPSLKAGAFQCGDESFQTYNGGKNGKLIYIPLGVETAAFDINLSGASIVRITGNRLSEPVDLEIK